MAISSSEPEQQQQQEQQEQQEQQQAGADEEEGGNEENSDEEDNAGTASKEELESRELKNFSTMSKSALIAFQRSPSTLSSDLNQQYQRH